MACNSLLMSFTIRTSSSSPSSASRVKPVRIFPALKSMLATVHASESILTTAGLNAGERALPLFKRIQAALKLLGQPGAVNSKVLEDRGNVVVAASSAFRR
jgi:hypothetical protein